MPEVPYERVTPCDRSLTVSASLAHAWRTSVRQALGYVLEAARNQVGRRRLAASSTQSLAERTAGSGRLLQPSGGMIGAATRWGTAPFRVLQRAFPNAGTGLVVLARLAG